jgi:hypothetical protein
MKINLSELKQIIAREVQMSEGELYTRDPAVNFVHAMHEVAAARQRLSEAKRIMADVSDERFQEGKSQIDEAYRILISIRR